MGRADSQLRRMLPTRPLIRTSFHLRVQNWNDPLNSVPPSSFTLDDEDEDDEDENDGLLEDTSSEESGEFSEGEELGEGEELSEGETEGDEQSNDESISQGDSEDDESQASDESSSDNLISIEGFRIGDIILNIDQELRHRSGYTGGVPTMSTITVSDVFNKSPFSKHCHEIAGLVEHYKNFGSSSNTTRRSSATGRMLDIDGTSESNEVVDEA